MANHFKVASKWNDEFRVHFASIVISIDIDIDISLSLRFYDARNFEHIDNDAASCVFWECAQIFLCLLTNCKIRETNVMAYTFAPAVIHKIKLNDFCVFVRVNPNGIPFELHQIHTRIRIKNGNNKQRISHLSSWV